MRAEVIEGAIQGKPAKGVVLIPENVKEWEVLTSIKHLHPLLPGVGSALFLTDAPFTEPDAASQKAMTSGIAPSTSRPFLVNPHSEPLTVNEVDPNPAA